MSILRDRVKAGLAGDYSGLKNGFNRLNEYIFGTQKATIILLGGESGTYKTTLLDFIIRNNIEDAEAKGIKINVFYNSWEIDELTKKCNWLSSHIFDKYGIVIPPKTIKGLGINRLTEDEQKIVDSEIDYIDELFKKITWSYTPMNPTGVYKQLYNFMEKRGTIEYIPYTDEAGKAQQKPHKFIANDPSEVNLVATDHLYYLKKERGFETKETIDKYSEYSVFLRNLFGVSFIHLQQFNDGLSSVDRQKFKGTDLSPQKTDFKDTRNTFADSDIVLGTMNPFKLDLDTCCSYDVNRLGKFFVALKLIKNRLEEDNVMFPLYVNPNAGTFEELPKDLTGFDYSKYNKKK